MRQFDNPLRLGSCLPPICTRWLRTTHVHYRLLRTIHNAHVINMSPTRCNMSASHPFCNRGIPLPTPMPKHKYRCRNHHCTCTWHRFKYHNSNMDGNNLPAPITTTLDIFPVPSPSWPTRRRHRCCWHGHLEASYHQFNGSSTPTWSHHCHRCFQFPMTDG